MFGGSVQNRLVGFQNRLVRFGLELSSNFSRKSISIFCVRHTPYMHPPNRQAGVRGCPPLFVFIYHTRHTDQIILIVYDFSRALSSAIFFLAFITPFYIIGMLTASIAF
jgi:hypothetical protein